MNFIKKIELLCAYIISVYPCSKLRHVLIVCVTIAEEDKSLHQTIVYPSCTFLFICSVVPVVTDKSVLQQIIQHNLLWYGIMLHHIQCYDIIFSMCSLPTNQTITKVTVSRVLLKYLLIKTQRYRFEKVLNHMLTSVYDILLYYFLKPWLLLIERTYQCFDRFYQYNKYYYS